MGGGRILSMIKRVYKDDPKATRAINKILAKNKKAKDDFGVAKANPKKILSKKFAKDDSDVVKIKSEPISPLKSKRRSNFDVVMKKSLEEKICIVDIEISGELKPVASIKYNFTEKFSEVALIDYINKKIWNKMFQEKYGDIRNFTPKISIIEGYD